MTLSADIVVRRGAFTLRCAFDVAEHSTLAVLGHNGAGKTTLLHAVAGLRCIDSGSISIDGVVVDSPETRRWVAPERRSLGVVFQDHRLFPHLTALDNVAYGIRAHGVARAAAREQAAEWLRAVGMAHRSGLRAALLSGGEAQRVSLARALAVRPRTLLLDEPLASVDVMARQELKELLREQLTAHDGMRILVTHEAADAESIADSVAVLEDGRLRCDQYPPDVAAAPAPFTGWPLPSSAYHVPPVAGIPSPLV